MASKEYEEGFKAGVEKSFERFGQYLTAACGTYSLRDINVIFEKAKKDVLTSKQTKYVNFYKAPGGRISSGEFTYDSKLEAEQSVGLTIKGLEYIGTFPVEIVHSL